jgi:hypothetical protein
LAIPEDISHEILTGQPLPTLTFNGWRKNLYQIPVKIVIFNSF